MADGKNLEDLVSLLKRITEETNNAVKNVARKQLGANEALKSMLDTQTRLTSEVEVVQKNLQSITDGQESLRDGMVDRLIDLKGKLADIDRQINSQNSGLKTLLEGQSKETARMRLEHERGQILVQMRSLLGEFKDGAVAYIFSSRGLSSLAIQGVVPSGFQALSDKVTADQIFRELKHKRDETSERDRQEAEKFESIDRLLNEIINEHSRYKNAKTRLNTERMSLTRKQEERRQKIAEIEQKIKDVSQTKSGKAYLLVAITLPILGLSLFLTAFAVREIAFVIVAFLVGLFWLGFLFFLLVRKRLGKIAQERHAKNISDINAEIFAAGERIRQISADEKKEDDNSLSITISYRDKIANIVTELRNRGLVIEIENHKLEMLSASESFEVCIKETKRIRETWIAHHPEVKRVVGLV